jgi:hypothetical protein
MMKPKFTMAAGTAVLATVLIVSFYGFGQSLASGGYDSDDHDLDHEYHEEYGDNYRQSAMMLNATYAEECGSCHMAYPAMLLSQQSWRKIMDGLEDHFGENAELDDVTRGEIEDYLVGESGRVAYKKLFRNLGSATPMRITELPYFVHKHDEIPARYITGNDQVRSLSQCNACHRDAQRGRFDEDDVVIPGFGRWDD